MTPAQILEEAKDRFVVLYLKDETKQETLLRSALRTYQEKAGAVAVVKQTEEQGNVFSLPSDFLEVCLVTDNRTVWHDHEQTDSEITIETQDNTEYPLILHYFRNLQDWDLDKNLPNGIASLVLDLLEARMAVQNTERAKNAAMQFGMTSVEFPSKQELEEQVKAAEEAIENAKAIVLPTAVF